MAWAGRHAAEKRDPFSDKNLARAVAEVVPLVERAAGRTFVTPPVVSLATPEVLTAMAREEQALITDAVLRDTSAPLRAQVVEERSRILGGLLGKYGLFA